MFRTSSSSVATRSLLRAAAANVACRSSLATATRRALSTSSGSFKVARSISSKSLHQVTRDFQQRRYASDSSLPPHTVITMPALSPTMTQGNIGAWHKKIGDSIAPGDVLVEIETDKAQMDFECTDDGFLAKMLIDSGAKDVPINTPIAVFVEDKDDIGKFADFEPESSGEKAPEAKKPEAKEEKKAAPQEKKSEAAEPKPKETKSAPKSSSERIVASPLAKSLASQKGISLSEVNGSGPNGRIVKADIDAFVPSAKAETAKKSESAPVPKPTTAPASSASAEFTDIPVSGMRKVIAGRLTQSKQEVPHYYVTVEIEMDRINKLREVLNNDPSANTKLSVNDFIVKASALALKAVPEANSAWNTDFIRQYHNADICVAVSTPGGLITPIVRKAETLGLGGISSSVRDLAARAREGKLKPTEYQGGSFTISNLGMFGVKSFTAIINPPQACILAVGGTEKKVVAVHGETGPTFEERSVMSVTLSSDHRVVDGAIAATWLKSFKGFMEKPLTMLL